MWVIPIAITVIAVVVGIVAVTLNPRGAPQSTTPSLGQSNTSSLRNQLKDWYEEEWFKVSVSGAIVLLLLVTLNGHWAWWLSGNHPRLFLSLVLLLALASFALERNYKKTKQWLWRVGMVIVLLFGILGASLEDYGKENWSELIKTGRNQVSLVWQGWQTRGAKSEDSGLTTIVAPADGTWSPELRLPQVSIPRSISYAPRDGEVEMLIVGTNKLYKFTPDKEDQPVEDLKGRAIRFRIIKPKKEVIVDIIWQAVKI